MTTTARVFEKKNYHSKRGQSIVEILPAIIILLTVMLAGLNYFRVMRLAVIRQEVVRNAMFAAIFNSGSLTTPSAYLSNPDGGPGADGQTQYAGHQTGGQHIIAGNNFEYVGKQTNCFVVYPRERLKTVETPLLPSMVQGEQPELSMITYAVMHRRWGGSKAAGCAP